ncbi:ATP-binding protein [Chromohalobacter israelensis]|uniref:ATP-binding protein n=1 Tax=Chromohalobacter israelensis TaxID=141390 RepID=UPI003D7B6468
MTTAAALLEQLRLLDESERIEAKRGQKLGKSMLETICAFANEPGLDGGHLVLGVVGDDQSHYRVEGVPDPDTLLNDLHSACASTFNVPLRVQAVTELVEGKRVVTIQVPEARPADKPVYFVKSALPRAAWRRGPNGDYRCNEHDLEVLYQQRSQVEFDRSVPQGATRDDIDPDALDDYRRDRRAMNAQAEELGYDDDELLEALGAAVWQHGELKPTLAGILLFGRRMAIRRLVPAHRVDYIRVTGKEWIEDPDERFTTIDMRDTLPRLINRAAAAVMDDLPMAFHLPQGSQQRADRPLIPAKVVREAIVNALMHRNYRAHQPVQIIRFSNRIEVRNPGYSLKPEEQLGLPGSAWRNPTLATVLHEVGYAETKGSGIRVMRRQMEQAGLTPPVFESVRHEDRFMATLLFVHFLDDEAVEWLKHFRHWQLSDEECRALLFVRETGRITNADYRDQNRVDTLAASQQLSRLRDLGLLHQVPKGAATYYLPGEHFPMQGSPAMELLSELERDLAAEQGSLPPESGGLPPESGGLPPESDGLPQESDDLPQEPEGQSRELLIAELPGWLALRLEAIGQRSRDKRRVRELLRALCAERPYRAAELSRLLKRNQEYLQKEYITPMRQAGELAYQYQDDPNRPDQAYVSPTANREAE